MAQLYYTAPPEENFQQLKKAAKLVWEQYNHPSYVGKKVKQLERMENVCDNFMYIVAMMDEHNQSALASMVSPTTRKLVAYRSLDGGNSPNTYPWWFERGAV